VVYTRATATAEEPHGGKLGAILNQRLYSQPQESSWWLYNRCHVGRLNRTGESNPDATLDILPESLPAVRTIENGGRFVGDQLSQVRSPEPSPQSYRSWAEKSGTKIRGQTERSDS
jgi:hypothetical protein